MSFRLLLRRRKAKEASDPSNAQRLRRLTRLAESIRRIGLRPDASIVSSHLCVHYSALPAPKENLHSVRDVTGPVAVLILVSTLICDSSRYPSLSSSSFSSFTSFPSSIIITITTPLCKHQLYQSRTNWKTIGQYQSNHPPEISATCSATRSKSTHLRRYSPGCLVSIKL